MEYNKCETCGACDGRAGMLFQQVGSKVFECLNCNDTRRKGDICVHAELDRTEEELKRTFNILNEKTI